ncbi:MAG TPA: PD-(D/E)XK nuclease-like domain-containing protein [Kribbellaceae bacterium]|nr:PD-(D/E)XK nuclease-like domain-containing protein [Kribbellaceae bacterium]
MTGFEPGVYPIPVTEYHRDPVPGGSLSSTGARRLLPPSCPALFRWYADHPEPHKAVFEEGHAAHRMILGAGPELVVVDHERWDTKAVKAEVAEIRERGGVPLKRAVLEQVEAMAAAIREHPVAAALLDPAKGTPEQSLFWVDEPSGVWRRALLDWLPEATAGRMILPEYKTTRSAEPERFARSAADYGYFQQAAWYRDAVLALGLATDVAFVFIAQEKDPPYLVTVTEPDGLALRVGQHLNRRAIDIYAECRRTGEWPGYSREVELISLPPWLENRYLEELTQTG